MVQKQLFQIAQQILIERKIKLELMPTINRYASRAVNRILNFCNREDLPQQLEDIVYQITEDMLIADGYIQTPNEVSSISRGDTSISYRDNSKNQLSSVDFIKDYESQLIRYKKPKLLGENYDGS